MNACKLFFILLALIVGACSENKTDKTIIGSMRSEIANSKRTSDTTLQIQYRKETRSVYILPAKSFFVKGNILLFHGWNLPPMGWCEQTTLCNKLRENGYNIIVPDMGKSMYASRTYPETLPTMAKQPQKQWLTDTVFPYLTDSLNILAQTTNNYLIGLSTGARGAFAIGLEYEKIFKAAIVLSGDYDQTLMKEDNLMTYFYGSYEDFPERWQGKDNLLRRANEWTIPIYIGHAIDDNVVPFNQSDTLYKTLMNLKKENVETHFPKNFGHDYKYWESETDNILKFIKKVENTKLIVSKK